MGTSNILPFRSRSPSAEPAPLPQLGTGEAFCSGCDHRWVAAGIVTGTPTFECPACRAQEGRWVFEFAPAPGQLCRTCDCGKQLVYLTPEGHMCAECGMYQRYD